MCETNNYINIQTGEKLDLDSVSQLKDNAMLKVKPELWGIWDFKKNDELGFDIWKMTKGQSKKAWWYCEKCSDTYLMYITGKIRGYGCSICSGKYVTLTNCLVTKNPELVSEWHPTKNGELTPNDVTYGSGRVVWWLGKCGHEWETSVNNRSIGKNNCPYCSGHRVLKGFNDMWTTNPELAKLLANPEDGYKYTYGSNQKVDWECKCGNIVRNKVITDTYRQGLSCRKCSDGISFAEKFIYRLLNQLNADFICQHNVKVNNTNKYYDFYIPSLNAVIEAHGIQHYKQSNRKTARTLEDEQANDKYKYEMAITNGIPPENYIVIDCRYSDFEFIKNNILNSRLAELFDLSRVDWIECEKNSFTSLILEACNLYENVTTNYDVITNKLKISLTTLNRYLRKGAKAGLCDFDGDKLQKINGYNSSQKRRIPVVQLNNDMNIIKEFDSAKRVELLYGHSASYISSVCKGHHKNAYGFKWMYKEDYDKYIKQKEIIQ